MAEFDCQLKERIKGMAVGYVPGERWRRVPTPLLTPAYIHSADSLAEIVTHPFMTVICRPGKTLDMDRPSHG
jgi:hypothetical protein